MIINQTIKDFFKKHNLYDEEMFKYFEQNSTLIDYQIEEERMFIGCFYIYNEKNILTKIHLNLPYAYDDKTTLINIHEIIHGIELYKKLNKKANVSDNCEILPMLYEKIYVEETQDEKLRNYQRYLDSFINVEDKKYYIALAVREELYRQYNCDMPKMQKKAKKLSKKHSKNFKAQ